MLIPTYERAEALVMTLSEVATQTVTNLQAVVSSQGRHKAEDSPVAQALRHVIEARRQRRRTPGIYHAQVATTTFSLESIVEADAPNR